MKKIFELSLNFIKDRINAKKIEFYDEKNKDFSIVFTIKEKQISILLSTAKKELI